MKPGAIFDARVVAVLICLGIAGFVGSLIVGSLAGDPEVTKPVGANGFSTSAVGHRAFRELLAELGHDVQTHTRKETCLLYTSPSPRDLSTSRMPSSA